MTRTPIDPTKHELAASGRDYKAAADRIAASRGGACLTESIPTVDTVAEWKCTKPDHPIWKAKFIVVRGSDLKEGTWCSRCGRDSTAQKRRFSTQRVREILTSRGIEWIAGEYKNRHSVLTVRFVACGCVTEAMFATLKQRGRCNKCAKNARTTRIEYEEFARKNGIELIEMAKTVVGKSLWRCPFCGPFRRSINSMQFTGTTCQECSKGFAERTCKSVLEQLFRVPFEKWRPKDLRGVGGNPLEIDLYNPDLKLAIEHHGAQHYQRKKFWGVERLDVQMEHDRRRREYLQSKGITLIEICRLGEVTKRDQLKQIIKNACLNGHVPLPKDYDEIQLDFSVASLKPQQAIMWDRVKEEAAKRGWTVLSPRYLGVVEKHEFRCSRDHPCFKTPSSLFDGEGCRDCNEEAHQRPVVIEDGRVFESLSAAATSLNRDISAVYIAAKDNGRCRRLRVAYISSEQFRTFRTNPELVAMFWKHQPPRRGLLAYNRKPVLLSDGRLFSTGTEAAEAIGAAPVTLYSAARREGTVRGYGVIVLSPEQEVAVRENPAIVSELWRGRRTPVRFGKEKRRTVVSSDCRIFPSIAVAARELKVNRSTAYGAIKTGGKCRGVRLKAISREEEIHLENKPENIVNLVASLWPESTQGLLWQKLSHALPATNSSAPAAIPIG